MLSKNESTQQRILEVGYELVVTKGFVGLGLSELLKSAGVPKGSFYHFFKSKEHFGVALIEAYFAKYLELIQGIFQYGEGTGHERLIQYFNFWLSTEEGVCNANRCLVVKLGAEVSDLSEDMSQAMRSGVDRIVSAIADCIELGINDGSIKAADSQQLARELYQLWVGSSLLDKLYQDQSELRRSMDLTLRILQGR